MRTDTRVSLGVAHPTFRDSIIQDKCNGVEGLCELEPEDVYWYGAHNVGTEKRLWLSNQTKTATQLLKDHGVRVLLADLYGSDQRDQRKNLGLTHLRHVTRLPGQKSHQEFLQEVAKFLEENPREVVILFYENHVQDWRLIQGEFEQAGLSKKIYDPQNPKTSHWTLGQMVKADKRLIVLFENKFRETEAENQARPHLYRDAYWERGLVQDSYYGRKFYKGMCERNRGISTAPFRQLNYWNKALPREKWAAALNGRSSFQNLGMACRKQDLTAFYNLYVTNHSHLGEVGSIVRSLNQALVSSQ